MQSEDWAGRGTPSGGRRGQPTQDNWLEEKKKEKKNPSEMFTDYGNKSTHHCLAVRQLLFSAEAGSKRSKKLTEHNMLSTEEQVDEFSH